MYVPWSPSPPRAAPLRSQTASKLRHSRRCRPACQASSAWAHSANNKGQQEKQVRPTALRLLQAAAPRLAAGKRRQQPNSMLLPPRLTKRFRCFLGPRTILPATTAGGQRCQEGGRAGTAPHACPLRLAFSLLLSSDGPAADDCSAAHAACSTLAAHSLAAGGAPRLLAAMLKSVWSPRTRLEPLYGLHAPAATMQHAGPPLRTWLD